MRVQEGFAVNHANHLATSACNRSLLGTEAAAQGEQYSECTKEQYTFLPCPIPAVFPCIGAPDASLLLPVISFLDGHSLVKVLFGTKLPTAIIIADYP